MTDLTLTTHTRQLGEIVDMVLQSRAVPYSDPSRDSRAFVLTPTDPIPARRLGRGAEGLATWETDGPTFAAIKRVENWGWLRRIARGYSDPGLVHPIAGVAFYVRQDRYAKPTDQERRGIRNAPIRNGVLQVSPARIENFEPVLIARLSDGRYFADQWADPSVLYDALSRWRNARGYLCDWQARGMNNVPACAIGGADWKIIPATIDAHRARMKRERDLAAERAAS